ncbi:MAG: tetratricopeptide repeat protein [Anaerolineae bacterium]
MTKQIFVRRERELTQLQTFLDRALAGQGQVCFVTGEAGTGKTALVTEFARCVQDVHADLVVAVGDCNAQTGLGDAYLPFREVLGLLTGDVESKLAEGTITEENANRLQSFLRVSGQALVDLGPELIEIFVPPVALATRAATFLAGKAGWLDRLEKLTERKQVGAGGTDPSAGSGQALDQSRIFEQYTNVLKAMARQQAMILVLDDLQWADAASISLLFHLGRRIGDSRIFIIGTYRPAEVALGRPSTPRQARDGASSGQVERHPLERVVNELKRYYGRIEVELESSAQVQDPRELERFVQDYIDQVYEPNRLDEDFKRLILERTEAHPLFLVELLRDIVARGWLAQDERGVWYQAQELDFHDLPPRVEAVIEERISRLEEELREILTCASVEGEDFTAQVVARVQQMSERQLLPRLSRELDRQHQLIGERGVERLRGKRLFLYRFRHSLFQRHLYNGLTEAERVLLHEDVGLCLEQLYEGQLQEVAVQLARHFLESYRYNKAYRYLVMAGEAAQAAYANQEAIAHYMRALALADEAETQPADPSSPSGQGLAHVHEHLGDVYSLTGEYQRATEHYEQALALAEESHRRATIHRKQGRTFEKWGRHDHAVASFEAGLRAMQEQLDAAEAARIYSGLGLVYYRRGELDEAIELGTLALHMAESIEDERITAQACNNLGIVHWSRGDWEQAIAFHRRSLALWEETQSAYGLAASHNNLGLIYHHQCDWELAVDQYHQSLEWCDKIGNRHGLARTYDNLGQLYMDQGQREKAMECLEKAVTILAEIGLDDAEIFPEMWQSGAW